MDRYASQMAAPSMAYGVAAGQIYQETALVQETVRSAIERLAKVEDHLASIADRASVLRDSVRPPGPQNGAANALKPAYSGVVGSLHGMIDAISDRASMLDRAIGDLAQAIG